MKTATDRRLILVFNAPSADLLMEMSPEYYRECQLAGAPSVEILLDDHSTAVISATRYLPADTNVAATVTQGVLQVLCTRPRREPVMMREFTEWTDYTVHRGDRDAVTTMTSTHHSPIRRARPTTP